ncbi:RdgB/HAM1 family non-canonical purine NTP pyrophosphatase [Aciditerrimonas ferrireducens]|uniref:RdgB/HAM1 family non-canonical purine NTP pyrophosphatase n=1 Tax=Aciditerrimonas ferrireducens TaxID=667306 RepID=UPI0020036186|nr:RdgB/HAM1 family non-canonical purine NTP pyrophosphatase [Aciditerrimonas ferrireducens]MCK4178184.1 RdgB/HAM1 family non-canonical purine NTP pyrophosphatase [Aciditerrimonas ferrireducens]
MRGSEPLRVVLATANPGKAAELAELAERLAPGLLTLLPRPEAVPPVPEDGDTYEANAEAKATALAVATGLPALADDSGLEVAALRGAPGIHSARYAGPEASDQANVAKLLAELAARGATAPKDRAARFVAVVVLRWPEGRSLLGRGEVGGTIAPTPRGQNGFGYDPVFVPAGAGGRTFAELDASAKHRLSHRGRALARLLEQFRADPGGPGPAGAGERT